MTAESSLIWLLVIATCALAGWWLAVRPGSSYRGANTSVSAMIIVAAILLCLVAIKQQTGPRRAAAASRTLPPPALTP